MVETAHVRTKSASVRARLRAALQSRAAVRQAVVLAEILAPPVALRGSRSAILSGLSRRLPQSPDLER